MKTNKILSLCYFLIPLIIVSCKKDSNNLPQIETKQEVLAYIKSLGFSESVIIDAGNEYIVAGDISFPKDMEIPTSKSLRVDKVAPLLSQDKLMSTAPGIGNSKISQSYTGSLVSVSNRINVKVSIDPSITNLTNEINNAIGLWNGVTESGISFSIVSGGTYDILIRNEAINGYGLARFPLNGSAGNLVRINVQNMINDGRNSNQMSTVIAHELGHCIGFRHTDWNGAGESANGSDDAGTQVGAIDVPNVGGTDANSIMNSGPNNTLAGVLSNRDALALVNLYPKAKLSGPTSVRRGQSYLFKLDNYSISTGDVLTWTISSSTGTIYSGQGTRLADVDINPIGGSGGGSISLKIVDANGGSTTFKYNFTIRAASDGRGGGK